MAVHVLAWRSTGACATVGRPRGICMMRIRRRCCCSCCRGSREGAGAGSVGTHPRRCRLGLSSRGSTSPTGARGRSEFWCTRCLLPASSEKSSGERVRAVELRSVAVGLDRRPAAARGRELEHTRGCPAATQRPEAWRAKSRHRDSPRLLHSPGEAVRERCGLSGNFLLPVGAGRLGSPLAAASLLGQLPEGADRARVPPCLRARRGWLWVGRARPQRACWGSQVTCKWPGGRAAGRGARRGLAAGGAQALRDHPPSQPSQAFRAPGKPDAQPATSCPAALPLPPPPPAGAATITYTPPLPAGPRWSSNCPPRAADLAPASPAHVPPLS